MKPYEQLIRHWKTEGLRIISPGVSNEALLEFEANNRVTLTHAFGEYLESVNGMAQVGTQDCDSRGFAFWPIDRIRSLPEECAAMKVSLPSLSGADGYFVFADYMQWSWAYAISLGTINRDSVLQFGIRHAKIIADSFAEFVAGYVTDAPGLYTLPSTWARRSL
jgi:hypothetical protein